MKPRIEIKKLAVGFCDGKDWFWELDFNGRRVLGDNHFYESENQTKRAAVRAKDLMAEAEIKES